MLCISKQVCLHSSLTFRLKHRRRSGHPPGGVFDSRRAMCDTLPNFRYEDALPMYYLSIDHIVKSYGYHQILNGVSFVVNAGERVGLVGANGVGKSTLLRIISGEVEADSGTITIPAGLQIGYLPQTVTGDDDQTLADLIAESMRHLVELESRMRALEKRMTTSESDELDAVMNEYGEISEQFERYGGYEMD